MEMLKKWYSKQSLAVKQFIFLFIVTSTLFTILAWSNLQDFKKIFEKQVINDSQQLVSQTNELLNTYLGNVQQILLLLSLQPNLLEEENEEVALEFLQKYGDLNRSVMKTVYLIREDGKVYSNRQVYYDIVGNKQLDNLVTMAKNRFGGIIWSEPYYTPLSDHTVAFISPIIGKNNHYSGLAVVEIDIQRLEAKLSPLFHRDNQTFLVMTSADNVVTVGAPSNLLQYEKGVYPEQLTTEFVHKIGDLDTGVSRIQGENGTIVAVKSNVNSLGWRVISLINERSFYHNLFDLYKNFWNVALLWIVILFCSSFMISRYFTNPIRNLVSSMDNINDINKLPSKVANRHDEIGHLSNSFHSMMIRIKTLFEEVKELEKRKKEYELKMLQSQISPHFLYNTLACINSLAKQQKLTEVRETIRSLIGLLSFSFNKTSELVSLKEELDGLEKYVQIQKVRYGDKFSLHLKVEIEAMDIKVLKLILQPLVENAIFHGIVPNKHRGLISIYGGITKNNRLKIYVRDNGIGIDSNLQRVLLDKPKSDGATQGFNSIGLVNVHERIMIHFGQEYGLRLRSKKNVGTIIRLELPIPTKTFDNS